MLIHEFGYSLLIGLCSVTSDITGHSHWYHSIKLIHSIDNIVSFDKTHSLNTTIDQKQGIKSKEKLYNVKVTGGSLLIHEFGYSLFIGLCSVTSDITGHSHSYHSIKLIHCGAPQRDVLSDKMVLCVVTHSFISCFVSLLY